MLNPILETMFEIDSPADNLQLLIDTQDGKGDLIFCEISDYCLFLVYRSLGKTRLYVYSSLSDIGVVEPVSKEVPEYVQCCTSDGRIYFLFENFQVISFDYKLELVIYPRPDLACDVKPDSKFDVELDLFMCFSRCPTGDNSRIFLTIFNKTGRVLKNISVTDELSEEFGISENQDQFILITLDDQQYLFVRSSSEDSYLFEFSDVGLGPEISFSRKVVIQEKKYRLSWFYKIEGTYVFRYSTKDEHLFVQANDILLDKLEKPDSDVVDLLTIATVKANRKSERFDLLAVESRGIIFTKYRVATGTIDQIYSYSLPSGKSARF